MSMKNILTNIEAKKVVCLNTSIFTLMVLLLIVFGNWSNAIAQEGNKYEEPWFPAARFAVKEGGKKEKAIIKLIKVEKASIQTSKEGLTYQICVAVTVKKSGKKSVKQYAQTTVFRDDKTMIYTLNSWMLYKTPPTDCQ